MTQANASKPAITRKKAQMGKQAGNSGPDETLLQNLLNGSLILGTILFFLNIYNSFQKADYVSVGIIFAAYGIIFLITFARMIPYRIRVIFLCTAFFMVGVISLLQSGVNANSLLYFLVSILIAGILEKSNLWILITGLTLLIVSILSYLFQNEIIEVGSALVKTDTVLYWISIIVNFSFLIILITQPIRNYVRKLQIAISSLEAKNSSLSEENQNYIQEKKKFEDNLDRRRIRLVTTRQISREISHQSNLEKLLNDSVDLIRTQLEYHHVLIFINDDHDENTLLKAAAGGGSHVLLDRNFRIRIHEPGIISSVITRGEAHIANDLSMETLPFLHSTLSNSQSELTVPLRINQRTIGVLDVQSDEKDTFGDEDIEMLQSIADQLSTVIDKNTQIQELRNQVNTLEESYHSFTRGTWRSHLKGTAEHLNYLFTKNALETEFAQSKISEDVLASGEAIIAPAQSEYNPQKNESIMAVPIILRDQVLGVLNIKYNGTEIPHQLSTLVSTASDRLALAIENARLLEQIQERADREHLVGEISSKLRAETDVDSILRTTATELAKSLGIDEVRIQLKTADSR
jgi:GAF domain-containing protein